VHGYIKITLKNFQFHVMKCIIISICNANKKPKHFVILVMLLPSNYVFSGFTFYLKVEELRSEEWEC